MFALKLNDLNPVFQGYVRRANVGEFFRWWGSGLLACLPLPMRRLIAGSVEKLIIHISNGQICLLEQKEDETRELYRGSEKILDQQELRRQLALSLDKANLKNKQIILRLPGNKVLSKTISLPSAAEANLRQVIGFEIDRLTPFSAERVYYDVQVINRQTDSRRIQVKFFVVSRAWVDALIKQLARFSLSPDTIDVMGEASEINLLPLARRPRKGLWERRLRWALVGLLLVFFVIASLLPLWQQRGIVIELSSQVAMTQKEAEKILGLRKELEEVVESSQFLLEKKRNSPLVIEILDELTRILPDHTWVEQLNIKDNEVQIRGQSQEASALIGLVESSKLFHNVTFRSPVTVDQRTGKDRFYLSAQIAKES